VREGLLAHPRPRRRQLAPTTTAGNVRRSGRSPSKNHRPACSCLNESRPRQTTRPSPISDAPSPISQTTPPIGIRIPNWCQRSARSRATTVAAPSGKAAHHGHRNRSLARAPRQIFHPPPKLGPVDPPGRIHPPDGNAPPRHEVPGAFRQAVIVSAPFRQCEHWAGKPLWGTTVITICQGRPSG
jgi:hypothetical protein